ncbi:MAG: hypothetical protein AAF501_02245, partial [Pseudomonadota bacterium]
MDDVNLGGRTIEGVWGETLEALRRLTSAGFPINIAKCQFLVARVVILGLYLAGDRLQLGPKAFRKLFAAELPRSVRWLQGLLGKLNFA